MAYVNLTAAQEKAIVEATKTQFMGMDEAALLRLADVLVGVASAAAAAAIVANTASITKLNAWGTTLATKLNADAGVTDTNYATNPQA